MMDFSLRRCNPRTTGDGLLWVSEPLRGRGESIWPVSNVFSMLFCICMHLPVWIVIATHHFTIFCNLLSHQYIFINQGQFSLSPSFANCFPARIKMIRHIWHNHFTKFNMFGKPVCLPYIFYRPHVDQCLAIVSWVTHPAQSSEALLKLTLVPVGRSVLWQVLESPGACLFETWTGKSPK